MTIKTISQLKEEIGMLPPQYEKALENQTVTTLNLEKLEQGLEKLEKELSVSKAVDETDLDDNYESDIEFIDLETQQDKLKLKLSETEEKTEIEIRISHEKITENYVRALVGQNEEVSRLRNEMIDLKSSVKIKKVKQERERQERWEKQKQNKVQSEIEEENHELDNLRTQVLLATEKSLAADDEAEVIRMKIETFKLLVKLESIEKT